MPPTTIRSAPSLDSFTSLEDHQSQTPTSFYGAKPVLHHHIFGASVLVASDQKSKLPIFDSATADVHEVVATIDNPSLVDVSVDVYVSSEQVPFT